MGYIYGLDLSMSNTGVSIYDTEIKKFVHVSSITTKRIAERDSNFIDGRRLQHIHDEFMILREKFPPSVVVIERGFTRFNTATQVLFRVHGVANLIFSDCPQIYYTPMRIKSMVYDGTATKKEISELIRKRLNLSFANEDESDAVAITLTYLIENEMIEWKSVKALTAKQKKKNEDAKKPKKKTTEK
jgi:Holliday junction resolvasome RuvABC endonuclease subunit